MIVSRGIFAALLATAFWAGPALAGADDVEENTSLVAPEVQDIDDPFRRGIDRVADQATGGVDLPSPSGDIGRQDTTGADLLGKSTEDALFSSRYRVVGVAVASQEMRSQIFAATNQNVIPGNKPRLAYVRLGLFQDEASARQLAIDLKNNAGHLLGAHFIMRDEGEAGVLMDFGPLRNVTHAERYCEIMLSMSTGLVDDCYTVLEFPGLEPLRTFSSTAMLKPSANAIRKVMKDDSLFDLRAAARQTITLREGDGIGATDTTLVKVTPRGIIVVAENGDIEMLPLDYLPEKAFDTEDLVGTGAAPMAPQVVINTPQPADPGDGTPNPIGNDT